jgi:hypothetical protein
LPETVKKRQTWAGAPACEHLGIVVRPDGSSLNRGGPSVVLEPARRLCSVPGRCVIRRRISGSCILPKVRWCLPFNAPPPWSADVSLMRSLVR